MKRGRYAAHVFWLIVVSLVAISATGCARQARVARKPPQRIVPAEPIWGPQAEGLQCRLRPAKRVFAAGESPAFKLDLRNRGTRVFAFLCGEQAPVHRFAIDGRWRRWPTPLPTEGRARALGPGVEIADLPLALPPEARPLLPPGRHVVQVAFYLEGIEVVSNPVEIEILASQQ